MKEKISLVMDPNKNPLQSLPKSQRFQIMVLLSIMWSSVFCLAFNLFLGFPVFRFGFSGFEESYLVTSSFSCVRSVSHVSLSVL